MVVAGLGVGWVDVVIKKICILMLQVTRVEKGGSSRASVPSKVMDAPLCVAESFLCSVLLPIWV